MKRLLVFGFVTVAALGPAWAQPDDDEDVDQDELDREVPPGFEEPEPDPEPEPPPDRTRRDREPEPDPEPPPTRSMTSSRRPEAFSIAIGAGWSLPSGDLLAPDLTTVRLRLPSGLTFEPLLHLSRASTTDDDGTNKLTTTTTDLSAAMLLRYPYRLNNRVDLSLVGALGLSQVSTDREMAADTSSTSIGLDWGFGLDYWIKPHWAVSFTALNPFAALTKTTTTDIGGLETSTSTNLIGVIFDPEVLLTFHLYL